MQPKFELMDGNQATAKISYKVTEFAGIYPITPSTPMAEDYEKNKSSGLKNIYSTVPKCVEMQSEAGVAGVLHGALCAGAISTTFTCSQGLLLMIPNMYKIAGELLPCVIHVASRTISTHALNIYNDHSDVMACTQTGFAILCANTPQECADLSLISYASSFESSVPFLHFFDGFRTSHEIQKVDMPSDKVIEKMMPYDKIKQFKANALSSESPYQKGTAQGDDVFFQSRIKAKSYYDKVADIVQEKMNNFAKLTDRTYHIFDLAGSEKAKHLIVCMGSACECIEEQIAKSEDTALLKIRLLNPFSAKHFIQSIPKNVEKICVLDRNTAQNQNGEYIYKEVLSAIKDSEYSNIEIINGIYGLGGKDFTPSMVKAIIQNLKETKSKKYFTIGINDDITNTSLAYENSFDEKHFSAMFFGIGSDGTVGACKNSIKLIGENTQKEVQGYFEYDSRKSGGFTISHLRISSQKIQSTYKISKADFVAIHNFDYVKTLNILKYLKDEAVLLLNTPFNPKELSQNISQRLKNNLINKKIKIYAINANALALEIGLKNKINTIMQASFFKITNIISEQKAFELLSQKTIKAYQNKGEEVVQKNIQALQKGFEYVEQITLENDHITLEKRTCDTQDTLLQNTPMLNQQLTLQGNNLSVSAMNEKGIAQTHTSMLDNKNLSNIAPQYICENCVQCNMCALVCPHSVIKPKLIKKGTQKPSNLQTLPSKAMPDFEFSLCIDKSHCTGCGLCAQVCPARQKALVMTDKNSTTNNHTDFLKTISNPTDKMDKFNLKHLNFFEPYFEYCGACAGCGETPYIKILTQLYGEKLVIANATGCSSIYAGSSPLCPFTKDKSGRGPAWANSLFEDNAEFGLGIKIASEINNKDDIIYIIGGDGWAYDIGFGGLDHVLRSGKNVNILVLDTEVYSNTGGQCSKSTPLGATAKFCSDTKQAHKKSLSMYALNYKDVFVAQVSLGANPNQCVQAIKEATEYNGVSLIIAYCPCINHGIDMSKTFDIMRDAVRSGYFQLFKYNPSLDEPMQYSPSSNIELQEFLKTQRRFSQISQSQVQEHKDNIEQVQKELLQIKNKQINRKND